MKNKEQNIGYRISDIESKIQDSVFSKFNIQHSTFNSVQNAPLDGMNPLIRLPFRRHSVRHGFTLIETMVALSILLIAVVGPISLIGNSLHKLYYAKDEMVATNLAQEGIEAVRQKRDSNLLAGAPTLWDSGITTGGYLVDANSDPMLVWCGVACAPQPVYIDAQGFYQQSAGLTATPFKRVVTIDGAGLGPNERKVVSTVSWATGGTAGSVTVSEYIFNLAP